MKTEKHFRDSIHGYIHVPSCIVAKIIDTELFQRLQDVEQTGMRPLFPAAKHNRFSHSLGVYQLGKEAARGFRKNAESIVSTISSDWWDKYELLFALACLLHDCAHAPYSHTYEFFYEISTAQVDESFLDVLDMQEGRDSLVESKIQAIDKALLSECRSSEFVEDYKIFRKVNQGSKGWEVNKQPHKAKPHEKLSAAMIGREYRKAIKEVLEELLPNNSFIEPESIDLDIEFMARCVIGLHYEAGRQENAPEYSLKNCFISLLNSNMLDVDGLDYMVRDAYNSGVDNGKIDYQRFFGSLTVAPVEVYENVELDAEDITGMWLSGTTLDAPRGNMQRLSLEGKFSMMFDLDKASDDNNDAREESADAPDWFTLNGKEAAQRPVVKRISEPGKIDIESPATPDFHLECSSAVRVEGSFTGRVSGERLLDLGTVGNARTSKAIEYILVYDKACISAIEHAIMARNFEYKWIYSHPKVVYYSSFLLCCMLRLSARYLCCKANPHRNGFAEPDFALLSCDGCSLANEQEPDFIIPKLLGFYTYVSDMPYEEVLFVPEEEESQESASQEDGEYQENNQEEKRGAEKDQEQEDAKREDSDRTESQTLGYRFYRSSDSDMRSLFKGVYLDNKLRGDNGIESVSKYFEAFFARKHQKALWKTYNEYREITSGFKKVQMENLEKRLLDPGKTSQKDYRILDGEVKDVFERNGIYNPVAVKAYLNLKEVDRHNTLIKTSDNEIVRFADVVDDRASAPKASFFYVYCDLPDGERPTNAKIKSILQEIAKLR